MANNFIDTNDENVLVDMGKFLVEELLRNTKDNSEKFNTETKE